MYSTSNFLSRPYTKKTSLTTVALDSTQVRLNLVLFPKLNYTSHKAGHHILTTNNLLFPINSALLQILLVFFQPTSIYNEAFPLIIHKYYLIPSYILITCYYGLRPHLLYAQINLISHLINLFIELPYRYYKLYQRPLHLTSLLMCGIH